jgi:diphthamide synthase (EF-2-diphthine--ammonia ligase)
LAAARGNVNCAPQHLRQRLWERRMPRYKTLLSWSTGKDAAWALNCLRQDPRIEVVGLVTTINAAVARVAMHGVRRELLDAQAAATGLPLFVLPLPYPCPNQVYEDIMARFVASQVAVGVEAMAFGDLFLAEVRRYREKALAGTGMRAIFPLWGMPTTALARGLPHLPRPLPAAGAVCRARLRRRPVGRTPRWR